MQAQHSKSMIKIHKNNLRECITSKINESKAVLTIKAKEK